MGVAVSTSAGDGTGVSIGVVVGTSVIMSEGDDDTNVDGVVDDSVHPPPLDAETGDVATSAAAEPQATMNSKGMSRKAKGVIRMLSYAAPTVSALVEKLYPEGQPL